MEPDEFKRFIKRNESASFKARNPHLFGPLARLEKSERKSDKRGESKDSSLERSKDGVGFRITLLMVRKRLVDGHDNLRWGAKPLVDAITASLGFRDDADPRLAWDYHQVKSDGRQGTIVKIERTEEA